MASPYTPNIGNYIPDNPGHWVVADQYGNMRWVDDVTGQGTWKTMTASAYQSMVNRQLGMIDEATGTTVEPAGANAAEVAEGRSMWDSLTTATDTVKTRAMGMLENVGEWAGVDSLATAIPVVSAGVSAAWTGWQIGTGIADLLGLESTGTQVQTCTGCGGQTSDVWSGSQNVTVCDVGEVCGMDPDAGYQEYAANFAACGDVSYTQFPECQGKTGHGGGGTTAIVTDPPGMGAPPPSDGESGCWGLVLSPYGGFFPSQLIGVPSNFVPVYEYEGQNPNGGFGEDSSNGCYNDGILKGYVNKVSYNGPLVVDQLPGPGQGTEGGGPASPTKTIHNTTFTPSTPTQAQTKLSNCLTAAASMACEAWNGTYCDLSGSGCQGVPVDHPVGVKTVTVPAPSPSESFTQYSADLTSAGFTAAPVEQVLSDVMADPQTPPNDVVSTDPAAGSQVAPTTAVQVDVNPGDATAGNPPSVVGPTPPGIQVPQPGTPCNVFPFGAPCWVKTQMAQFASENATAPSFSFGMPSIAGGGSLAVNLDHPFGVDLTSIMSVVRIVLLAVSAIGLMMWIVSFSLGGSTEGGGTEQAHE